MNFTREEGTTNYNCLSLVNTSTANWWTSKWRVKIQSPFSVLYSSLGDCDRRCGNFLPDVNAKMWPLYLARVREWKRKLEWNRAGTCSRQNVRTLKRRARFGICFSLPWDVSGSRAQHFFKFFYRWHSPVSVHKHIYRWYGILINGRTIQCQAE